MRKLVTGALFLLIIVTTVTGVAFAQETRRPPIIPEGVEEAIVIPHSGEDSQVSEEEFFGGRLLPLLTQTIIALAGGLAFLFMIIGGIQILTAYGNEEKIASGKKTMTYAIVGLLVALLSYAIVSIIGAIQLVPQQTTAPGTEDMTPEEQAEEGPYGPGGTVIQGGVQPQ